MGSYLDQRKGGSSQSFFKKVESLIPTFSQSVKEIPEESDSAIFEDKPEKKRSFFWFLFSSAKKQEDYTEDELDEIEHVEDEIENIEHQEEDLEEDIEELEEKRESLLQRLFSFLSGRNKDEEEYDYDDDDYEEDVEDAASIREQETRATLKIIHKWIGRLPSDQIDAFKRSPDFQKYKDLLDLYNLIK